MAAFPFVHPTFLLDSDFLQNTSTIKMCSTGSLMEESFITNNNNYFYGYNPSQLSQQFDARTSHEGISSVENNSTRSHHSDNEQSQTSGKYKTDSSSMVIEIDGEDQDVHKETQSQNKKRKKSKDGSCLSSGQSKDLKETKAKKQKKCNGRVLKGTDEMKSKADKKNHNGVTEEPPTGYIHVRARRGQATDSHSLAERVRREKISERMKLLQSLVPGCDKVTGKALMLDEIINYVQSLQNQVEFLSMKIASVNPMFYDFGADLEALVKPEKQSNVVPPLPSMQHSTTPTQLMTGFPDTTTTFTTRNNYHLLEFQQEQRPIPIPQVNENLLLDVDEQRQQIFINQSWLNHLSSFQ